MAGINQTLFLEHNRGRCAGWKPSSHAGWILDAVQLNRLDGVRFVIFVYVRLEMKHLSITRRVTPSEKPAKSPFGHPNPWHKGC
ncbi:hypothetical protein EVAR_27632_1 [Eumeta japonica]|uniref:Uncharacterized protein n=1 Tax=Eumeta variegata TaxID=151549 RepID=A0A4C1V0E2_EUMVA|nr:hypothetical protein EVAR_27632_1 [Eumeta japonica]